jgi:transcriptional regulator with XRE-family HTH domain
MNPLREFRVREQLSQEDLAALLGVSQSAITHYECGRRKISAELAIEFERRTGARLRREIMRPDLFGPPPAECPCQDKAASA